MYAAPVWRCCFYRRFVCFIIALLHIVNDSLICKGTGYILILAYQTVLECFAGSAADLIECLTVIFIQISGASYNVNSVFAILSILKKIFATLDKSVSIC